MRFVIVLINEHFLPAPATLYVYVLSKSTESEGKWKASCLLVVIWLEITSVMSCLQQKIV